MLVINVSEQRLQSIECRESAMTERRLEPRAKIFEFGTVLSDGTSGETTCVIWDASGRGARIEVEHPEKLPQRFVLDIGDRNNLKRCNVIWRIGRKVGVVFEPGSPSEGVR
ncbi:hypothetical protein GCM10007887_25380 [Methylobacterium haplocladii]|uniref:PilZ domain-containing protein n=1 Tax=Methylobacterium haplocladii TaxID=1176176 RepID=A0A512IQT5_9HYPH|nr:hypothetical protein MHA02_24200 [Methylobacterium haplocladii]GLS59865.1 hypothetical protein GCM10007887_25380 [Methylobacterium haplocladii]